MQLGRKVTDEKASAWMRDMTRFLWDQEQALLLFRTTGMSIDLVLVTSARMIGWSNLNVSKGPKAAILWSEIVDYRYTGMTDKLVVRKAAGDEVNFGPAHKDDRPLIDQLLRQHRPSPLAHPLAAETMPAAAAAPTVADPFGDAPPGPNRLNDAGNQTSSKAWIEELAQLGDLFERGLLDEREFRLAKQKLLRDGS